MIISFFTYIEVFSYLLVFERYFFNIEIKIRKKIIKTKIFHTQIESIQ